MKIWNLLIVFALIAGVIIVLNSLFYSPDGLNRLARMKNEYDSILVENRKLREENQHLKMQIELLKNDEKYIEKVARERNLIKEGDIVFRVK